jgi:arsenate reductase
MKVTTDMTTLYGISNCDTCRKAKNWFNENRIAFDFFDFRKNELTQTKIETWIDSIGLDKLINRRGTTWRNLPDELRDQIHGPENVDVLNQFPTLMKRPIIEIDDHFLVGFDASVIKQIQAMKM